MSAQNLNIHKIDAARIQLRSAIQMWFADGEPISIHTLAGAAHQIIHDILKHKGERDTLFDSIYVKKERRSDWLKAIKEHMNFFKHADKDPDGIIKFDPLLNEPFILLSLFDLERLGIKLSDEESSFIVWCFLHNPDWFSEQAKAGLTNHVNIDKLAKFPIHNIARKDFKRLYNFSFFV